MSADTETFQFDSSSFLRRGVAIFVLVALASAGISLGGKLYGRSIAMGGHTDSSVQHEIVIGNNVIVAPENMIRFAEARRDGVARRLDLYLRWPDMSGYSKDARDDFNHVGDSRKILFLSFEEQSMSRDMSGRFAPIYDELIDKPGVSGPSGLTIYNFSGKSGYVNESLAVTDRPGDDPFVARCMTGEAATGSLAPCERDIQLGDNLSLSYRFSAELLSQWPALEAAVRASAVAMLQTGRR